MLISDLVNMKDLLETTCSLLVAKLDGFMGYLKMIVPRVTLEAANKEILRGNAEIKKLRALSIEDNNSILKLEESLALKTSEVKMLAMSVDDMVRQVHTWRRADEAQIENHRFSMGQIEIAKEQILNSFKELHLVQASLDRIVAEDQLHTLQQKLECMVSREDYVQSQAQLQIFHEEISWTRTLISELLSKVKQQGKLTTDFACQVDTDLNMRWDRFSSIAFDAENKRKQFIYEAEQKIESCTRQVVWMRERMANAQERLKYKFECLYKFVTIMIPKQFLDLAIENARHRAQEIQSLELRIDKMVPQSDLWAAHAEIARLNSVIENMQEDSRTPAEAVSKTLLHTIQSKVEIGADPSGTY